MLWIEWPSVKFARPKGFLGLRTFSATTGIVPGTQGWLERERERAEVQAEENVFHLVGNGEPLMGNKKLTRYKLYFGRRSLKWGDQPP